MQVEATCRCSLINWINCIKTMYNVNNTLEYWIKAKQISMPSNAIATCLMDFEEN